MRIPMTFGNPCDWRMLRNSKVSCMYVNKFHKEIFGGDDVIDTYHLKTERAVYHEQYEISDFSNVNHTVEVVVTFDKGEAFFFAADHCDWSFCFIQGLFCITSNKTFEQGSFTDTWRTNYGNDNRWWIIIWCTVDEGDMKTGLITLDVAASLTVCSST